MDLSNKVALVTGGAQGLGRAFSEGLLKRGAKVCICDVNKKQGEATLSQWSGIFGPNRVLFVPCDVTDHDQFDGVFKRVIERFGGIDIVVNNAGVGGEEESTWRRTIQINLIGVIEGTRLASEYLSKMSGGRGGLVLNIASTAGLTPVFYMPVYVASKYGVVGLTRSYAASPSNLNETGIRYVCLCPAFTATALFGEAQEKNFHAASSIVGTTGVNTVESVVNAFMQLVENPLNNGAVMTISVQKGIEYRHGKPPNVSRM